MTTKMGTFEGIYCYVGSAFGPGGLKARVSRHLRHEKPLRWHIDYLTTSSHFVPRKVFASDKRAECDLAFLLAEIFRGHSGFGSSDCRCPTHLFAIDSVDRLQRALIGAGFEEIELDQLRA
ncbi:MAG: DUF123 domain-containing protein [Theionarchaea archaeon]|nr:DUF123 domain-containing protein [Theionarchaea archaeon]